MQKITSFSWNPIRVILFFFLGWNQFLAAQDLPPLIDRDLFFGDPAYSNVQISPDGNFLSFLANHEGVLNIWVRKLQDPMELAVLVTNEKKRSIAQYFWSRDSRHLLFLQDEGGNEDFRLFSIDLNPASGGLGKNLAVRDLSSGWNGRVELFALPNAAPGLVYVGTNNRDAAWMDLYSINLKTGEKTLVWENKDRIKSWTFDLAGNLRLATRIAEGGGTEILKLEDQTWKKILECAVFETCDPLQFHPSGSRFYLVTNKTDKLEYSILASYNLNTNAMEAVEVDPAGKVDFGGAIFSPSSQLLAGTYYDHFKRTYYWKEKRYKEAYARLQKEFPGKDARLLSVDSKEKFFLWEIYADNDPGMVFLYASDSGILSFQLAYRPGLNTELLASTRAITYRSRDGLEIPAYLTVPNSKKPQEWPLVVYPHGGPWSRDYWEFDPFVQFLANRGYAVLQPNFRGSTGYGKQFLNAGNYEWGRKMQDDLTSGVEALVQEGTVDPNRIGIFGISYGGYAALAGLTFTPYTYKCGISMVGPSNLITLLNSIPSYWEEKRQWLYGRMGDPNDPTLAAVMKKQSPFYAASNIKSPLMIVQGANDVRVKKAESEQIVVACRDLGLPVEYLLAEDEGHGFRNAKNKKAFVWAMEQFFATHLNGRIQKEVDPEVEHTLEILRQDVARVEVAPDLEAANFYKKAPTPTFALHEGAYLYKINMKIQDQSFQMDMHTKITDQGETWLLEDVVESALGQMVDRTTVDKVSLQPINRQVNQGPMVMIYDYLPEKISAKVLAGGDGESFEIGVPVPLFAEGAGSKNILACLPLEPGFETSYRNFDAQNREIVVMKLKVIKMEEVEVPAGIFNSYRCEITRTGAHPGQSIIWVASDPQFNRKVVKSQANLPKSQGGTITSELQE